jgi:hypothetical protein
MDKYEWLIIGVMITGIWWILIVMAVRIDRLEEDVRQIQFQMKYEVVR